MQQAPSLQAQSHQAPFQQAPSQQAHLQQVHLQQTQPPQPPGAPLQQNGQWLWQPSTNREATSGIASAFNAVNANSASELRELFKPYPSHNSRTRVINPQSRRTLRGMAKPYTVSNVKASKVKVIPVKLLHYPDRSVSEDMHVSVNTNAVRGTGFLECYPTDTAEEIDTKLKAIMMTINYNGPYWIMKMMNKQVFKPKLTPTQTWDAKLITITRSQGSLYVLMIDEKSTYQIYSI